MSDPQGIDMFNLNREELKGMIVVLMASFATTLQEMDAADPKLRTGENVLSTLQNVVTATVANSIRPIPAKSVKPAQDFVQYVYRLYSAKQDASDEERSDERG